MAYSYLVQSTTQANNLAKRKTSCGWSCAKLMFSLCYGLDIDRWKFVPLCSKVRSKVRSKDSNIGLRINWDAMKMQFRSPGQYLDWQIISYTNRLSSKQIHCIWIYVAIKMQFWCDLGSI